MTIPTDRPHTALVVIDVQNTLVGTARDEGVAIVWVQHSDDELEKGSDEWKYVSELVCRDFEPVVHETFGDSCEGTDPEKVIAHTNPYRQFQGDPGRIAAVTETAEVSFAW